MLDALIDAVYDEDKSPFLIGHLSGMLEPKKRLDDEFLELSFKGQLKNEGIRRNALENEAPRSRTEAHELVSERLSKRP